MIQTGTRSGRLGRLRLIVLGPRSGRRADVLNGPGHCQEAAYYTCGVAVRARRGGGSPTKSNLLLVAIVSIATGSASSLIAGVVYGRSAH